MTLHYSNKKISADEEKCLSYLADFSLSHAGYTLEESAQRLRELAQTVLNKSQYNSNYQARFFRFCDRFSAFCRKKSLGRAVKYSNATGHKEALQ